MRKPGAGAITGLICVFTLVALLLVRTCRIRLAALYFVPTVWCLAEGYSAMSGGLKSYAYSLVVLIIVNAGWLLGRSSAIGLAVATLLVSLAESVLE